jgi:hypothetical protein
MRVTRMITSFLALAVLLTACTTAVRRPVTDVPAGTYVQVEPTPEVYSAVAINERAWNARFGDQTLQGQHWIDRDGRLRMADDAGPCAGQESIWTYSYSNNRVTLDLIEDRCATRPNPFPQRMVYERR